ncbi:MAG: inorganic phosphate transporter [Acidobacteria bacterium]|nr:inorganic phosphate transporter [Acidobacteriota bacterium]
MLIIILYIIICCLAYNNGANDNFKGVATLYGSGLASYKKALYWASLTTFLGGVACLFLANSLAVAFSGKGLVPDTLLGTPNLLISLGLGSSLTLFLANRLGLPVSTTHALTGGLVGITLITKGTIPGQIFLYKFLLPLLLSPVLAIILATIFSRIADYVDRNFTKSKANCVCVDVSCSDLIVQPNGVLAQVATPSLPIVKLGQINECAKEESKSIVKIDLTKTLDITHYLSAGAVCFSRALNDTPKIAALLMVSGVMHISELGLVLVAMMVGGLVGAKKVAEIMSHKIANFDRPQGLSANLVTSLLVLSASNFGLPVSTTHVSCGSIFGVGLASKTYRWDTIKQILSAWLSTFPLSMFITSTTYLLVIKLRS